MLATQSVDRKDCRPAAETTGSLQQEREAMRPWRTLGSKAQAAALRNLGRPSPAD